MLVSEKLGWLTKIDEFLRGRNLLIKIFMPLVGFDIMGNFCRLLVLIG